MASAPINKVQDKNGDQFFPITHQQAVINDNGDDLVTILAGKLTGVTFNGTPATITSGVAAITASIPAAPGTLNTNNSTAQTASSSEALSGTIKLHKVSKTGTYSDLIGTPTIPAAPGTLVTNKTTAQTASSGEAMSGTINLHKIAKTGTYSDLIGTPTIPSSLSDLSGTSDLQAIEALAGTSGVLKKTAANTWALDTATFYTSENSNKNTVDWECMNLKALNSVKIYTVSSSPGVLEISSAAGNGDAGYIHFSSTQNMNGFRIASEGDGWASRQRLVFYRSDNTTSPYGFTPTEIMRLSTNGNVAVTGNITATGTITPGSDSRIKDNQKTIDPKVAIDTISRLTPKTWEWNEKAVACSGGKAAGLIAQEVADVIPEAVIIGEALGFEDFHSLNYNTIQGYELAAIKGLIEEIKTLRAELAELKKT